MFPNVSRLSARRRPQPGRAGRCFRPALEALEDRLAPAIFPTIATGDVQALLDAVTAANSNDEEDTINLAPGGTYSLTQTLSFSNADTNDGRTILNGNGATLTRDSTQPEFGIILVNDNARLSLDRVTITNGSAIIGGGISADDGSVMVTNSTISGNSAQWGGGIYSKSGGSLTVANSTITDNVAIVSGGGIYAHGTSGTVTVANSTISGNFAGSGGGVAVGGSVTVVSSTISGNFARGAGGGIGIGIDSPGTAVIRNSTIAFNTADSNNAGAGAGGGLFVSSDGSATLQSTIVANNVTGLTGTFADVAGTVLAGHSLVEDTFGTIFAAGSSGNVTGKDPRLGPLADNGGPTLTHALLAGSPAIDQGTRPQGLEFDQRGEGFARAVGPSADIGAFESDFQPLNAAPPSSSPVGPRVLLHGGRRKALSVGKRRGVRLFRQRVVLTNPNAETLTGPFRLALDGLAGGLSLVRVRGQGRQAKRQDGRSLLLDFGAGFPSGAEMTLVLTFRKPGVGAKLLGVFALIR